LHNATTFAGGRPGSLRAMSDWTAVGDGIFVKRYASLDLNIGALICGEGVALIDTRANLVQARELRSDVARLTSKPVAWVINTHHHWDHTFGNAEFAPAPIWGHSRCVDQLNLHGERMRSQLKEWAPDHAAAFDEVEIVPPDHTFDGATTVSFSGRELHFRHLGRGHTDNDIIIEVPDAGVVFAGDLIEEGNPPAFGDAFPLEWADAVQQLADRCGGPVVPGHGAVVDRAFVEGQQRDLASVADLAAERHDAGMTVADAARLPGPFPAKTMEQAFGRAWPALDMSR